MRLQLELSPVQRQRTRLTARLKQSIFMLQVSSLGLNEFLQEFLLDNPTVDWFDDSTAFLPGGWSSTAATVDADGAHRGSRERRGTLEAELTRQLGEMTVAQPVRAVCAFIVGNVDRRGYVELSVERIAAMRSVPPAVAMEALQLIRGMDPPGVGASSLVECLLLQLERRGEHSALARELICRHLPEVAAGKLVELARIHEVRLADIERAVAVIRGLSPFPGYAYGHEPIKYIVPDLIVEEQDGAAAVTIQERAAPALRWNRYYADLMKSGAAGGSHRFLKKKMAEALWVMTCIERRRSTLHLVAAAIFTRQIDFLRHGFGRLLPLSLKEVAQEVGLHESTVSRAIREKYAQTPWGVYEVKEFFPSGIGQDDGLVVSSDRIKREIRTLIDSEQARRPLSDQQIAAMLDAMGMRVARRTVAKYRESLGIAPVWQRRR